MIPKCKRYYVKKIDILRSVTNEKKSHIYQNQVFWTNFQLLSPLVCQYGLLGTTYIFYGTFFKVVFQACLER